MKGLPLRFSRGVEAINTLANYPRYEAAFIFGSVAEGTSTEKSDLDVRVVVDRDNRCENVSHPMVDGYKLDISFISFAQLKVETEEDIKKAERRPVLAGALIVFDKTGELTALGKVTQKITAKKYAEPDYLFTQFMLYHVNDKVERYLDDDPVSALYSMHANIGDVLKYHYKLQGKWWVSSKRIMADLKDWDPELAKMLKSFVLAGEIREKYRYWSKIIDCVTAPMGGRLPMAENNCDCEVCKGDLAALAL